MNTNRQSGMQSLLAAMIGKEVSDAVQASEQPTPKKGTRRRKALISAAEAKARGMNKATNRKRSTKPRKRRNRKA